MILQELFDTLLKTREVQVVLSKQDSENLRIALVKKWNKYKVEMDSLGFLADDLATCSVSRRAPTSDSLTYCYLLVPKRNQPNQYEILPS